MDRFALGALRLREEATASGLKFVEDERSLSEAILNHPDFGYSAALVLVRHNCTRSSITAVPAHMTVSAPPQ